MLEIEAGGRFKKIRRAAPPQGRGAQNFVADCVVRRADMQKTGATPTGLPLVCSLGSLSL